MIADWTVEAGAESPVIAVPWEHWADLRSSPAETGTQLAERIAETRDYPELIPLLLAANTRRTLSSKVDVFPVTRADADPEIAEAGIDATAHGLGSYLDLLACRLAIPDAFADYEEITRDAVRHLHRQQQELCAIEIVLRPARLYGRETFGWSLYALGFGQNEGQARENWARAFGTALHVLQHSIAARADGGTLP